ncbi:hypothetical protein [Candidatus Contubernalis alkaliaceticus]|uniref:hypothetical protein n=1 Tax=Candidatus Contubernalis alkaliaceticus TaxID=338645 RepID=UPI001F4BE045|nr:hypothetical protein [Candidatus Contubernalis alkalaceticus]UNC91671.1 hypothetical protein HUE98_05930 [Candidatus Contubernalis alkalaceticus]
MEEATEYSTTNFGLLNGCQLEEIRKNRMWAMLEMYGEGLKNLNPREIGITIMDIKCMILLVENSKLDRRAKKECRRFITDALKSLDEAVLAVQRLDNAMKQKTGTQRGEDF